VRRRKRSLAPSDSACFNPGVLLSEVEYARPPSVEEALRLLSENDNARALAGGQTLINVMKQRAASPDMLVDLAELEELTPAAPAADGRALAEAIPGARFVELPAAHLSNYEASERFNAELLGFFTKEGSAHG